MYRKRYKSVMRFFGLVSPTLFHCKMNIEIGKKQGFFTWEPLVCKQEYSLWRGSPLPDLALTPEVNPITQRC